MTDSDEIPNAVTLRDRTDANSVEMPQNERSEDRSKETETDTADSPDLELQERDKKDREEAQKEIEELRSATKPSFLFDASVLHDIRDILM